MEECPASLVAHEAHGSSFVTKEGVVHSQGSASAFGACAELFMYFDQRVEVGVGGPGQAKALGIWLKGKDNGGFWVG